MLRAAQRGFTQFRRSNAISKEFLHPRRTSPTPAMICLQNHSQQNNISLSPNTSNTIVYPRPANQPIPNTQVHPHYRATATTTTTHIGQEFEEPIQTHSTNRLMNMKISFCLFGSVKTPHNEKKRYKNVLAAQNVPAHINVSRLTPKGPERRKGGRSARRARWNVSVPPQKQTKNVPYRGL